jgi:ATP-dependent DNA ligase
VAARKVEAQFIEPMLLLRSGELPEGLAWVYELKLDGYRAVAFKSGKELHLRSRNNKDFNGSYSAIARALRALPDETVIDGEVVALDDAGRPSFNLLQNYGSSKVPVVYYIFDIMVLAGTDVMGQTLESRRALLESKVLPKLAEPIRYSPELPGTLADLIQSVKAQKLEGVVAKRRTSIYEPGERSGAWLKMRVNQDQEFVIGGYTVGGSTFDALVFGHYEGEDLIYVGRTRNGFTPKVRQELMNGFRQIGTDVCPFVNLPEAKSGRWGAGLTAAKMKDCRWLKPSCGRRLVWAATGQTSLKARTKPATGKQLGSWPNLPGNSGRRCRRRQAQNDEDFT